MNNENEIKEYVSLEKHEIILKGISKTLMNSKSFIISSFNKIIIKPF